MSQQQNANAYASHVPSLTEIIRVNTRGRERYRTSRETSSVSETELSIIVSYRRLPGPGALSVVVRPTLQLVPVDLRTRRDPLLLYLLQCPRPMFHCLLVHPRQDIWMWMAARVPEMVMVFVCHYYLF